MLSQNKDILDRGQTIRDNKDIEVRRPKNHFMWVWTVCHKKSTINSV